MCKAEDVPEYKGSLPMDELLAFVEGSVPAPALRLSESKIRRIKRKEAVDGDHSIHSCCNGSALLVRSAGPHENNCRTPRSAQLNGLSVGRSKRSTKMAVPPINSEIYSEASGTGQLMDDWLTSEIANHLMVHDDFDDDLLRRKEKEFVLVQKKRKQKPAAIISLNGDVGKPAMLNGLRYNDTRKMLSETNGFVQHVLKANGIAVSRNSSEISFTQSTGSDIDDLSHFAGEGQDGSIFAGDLFVDAQVQWDEDKDESCASVLSVGSSDDSLRFFAYLSDSGFVHKLNGLPKDCDDVVSIRSDNESMYREEGMQIQSECYCAADVVQETSDHVEACDAASELVHLSKKSHELPLQSTVRAPSPAIRPQAVAFVDARANFIYEDTADVTFTFGCMLPDHLTDGGLCTGYGPLAVSGAGTFSNSVTVSGHACSCSPKSAASDCCTLPVSFMFSDSTHPDASPSVPKSTKEILPNRTVDAVDDRDNTDVESVHFRVIDAQVFLYTCFEDVWSSMLQGENDVVMYSALNDITCST